VPPTTVPVQWVLHPENAPGHWPLQTLLTPLAVCRGAGLSLSRLQEAMGDSLFNNMLSGRASALLCAMKSLPTYDMLATDLPNEGQVLMEEAECVERLQARLSAVQAEFETSESADNALLERGGLDGWVRVAVQYRRERKRLARSAAAILNVYRRLCRDGPGGANGAL
jgi:hypothetical protein